jgi:hypothetical protein
LLSGDDSVLLVGDSKISQAGLDSSGLSAEQKSRYRIVHTTQIIEMDESPVEAVRGKPDSSIAVMCKLASKGEADVVISAGNTGCVRGGGAVADADAAGDQPAGDRGDRADVLRAGGYLRCRGQRRAAANAS